MFSGQHRKHCRVSLCRALVVITEGKLMKLYEPILVWMKGILRCGFSYERQNAWPGEITTHKDSRHGKLYISKRLKDCCYTRPPFLYLTLIRFTYSSDSNSTQSRTNKMTSILSSTYRSPVARNLLKSSKTRGGLFLAARNYSNGEKVCSIAFFFSSSNPRHTD